MPEPYTKEIRYTFDIGEDDIWAVLYTTPGYILFEETRKNGQEDCHMGGEAVLAPGDKWEIDKDARKQIEMYAGPETVDAIEAFFDKHGQPPGDAG